MCEYYETERRFMVDSENRASREGYEAAQRGNRANPYSGPFLKSMHASWEHGWNCWKAGLVPWGVERQRRSGSDQANIAPKSFLEPGPGYFVLNAGDLPVSFTKPRLRCILDVQDELGARSCPHLIPAIVRTIQMENGSTLCIEWPDAGETVPEIVGASPGVHREKKGKDNDGGSLLYEFWTKLGRPASIEVMGENMNVCVFNLVHEFFRFCQENSAPVPQIHFRVECLGDTNYPGDQQREGWDHFRLVTAEAFTKQKPPRDTVYLIKVERTADRAETVCA